MTPFKTNATQSALFIAGLCLTSASQAQSSLEFFGSLDLGVRYSTNQSVDGGKLLELSNGANRINNVGFTGSEDLGNGNKAIFMLDAGLATDTGTVGWDGSYFSRQAWVGIETQHGQITVGRQFTPLYNAEWAIEPFGANNVIESGFIYANYGGDFTWNNAVMLQTTVGDFTGVLMASLGEQAGNSKAGRSVGGSVAYASGKITANSAYQEVRNEYADITSKAWNVGGSYELDHAVFFAGYMNHKSDITPQTNDIYHVGLTRDVTPQVEAIVGYYYDKQSDVDGKKETLVGMLSYNFSLRTSVYVQADYSKIDAGYLSNVFDASPFPSTPNAAGNGLSFDSSRTSVTIGLRHLF